MKKKSKRRLFKFPWHYKEGFVISLFLIALGLLTDYIANQPIGFPKFPTNLSLIVSFTLLLVAFYKFEKNNKIIQWLASIPAGITSTVLFIFISALLGIFPQVNAGMPVEDDIFYRLGFTHITSSRLFAFSILFFVTVLGFATVKMFMPFKKKKLGVLLSHLGLYIIILTGIAGSGDNLRTYFVLEQNEAPTNEVRTFDNQSILKTPFKLKLIKFDIVEYNPKIVLVSSKTDSIYMPDDNKHCIIDKETEAKFKNYKIKIKEFIKNSVPTDTLLSNFVHRNDFPSLPAAYVEIFDNNNNLINKDWITCGNYLIPKKNIRVNKDYYFAVLTPEPKEYSSIVKAYLPPDSEETFTLKVNSPKTIKGWKLYQTGYNEKLGKWSNYSVIEAGFDPWLPAVYTGIFILMAGAIYLFWLGRQNSKDNEEEKIHLDI